MEGFADIIHAF